MAKKITYLLGAGASANTIPVVADMRKRLAEVHNLFMIKFHPINLTPGLNAKINSPMTGYSQAINEIAAELKWLIDEAGAQYTIDSLAKQYYLTDDSNYHRLKSCLIIYFIFEQYVCLPSIQIGAKEYGFIKQSVDKRYSHFINVIAKKAANSLSLNGNIKVLTWNYDQQIELALQSFFGTTIHKVQLKANIHPNRASFDNAGKMQSKENEFEVIKLNGNATWETIDTQNNWYTIFDKKVSSADRLEKFIEYYKTYRNGLDGHRQFFNFSWEALEDNGNKDNYWGLLTKQM